MIQQRKALLFALSATLLWSTVAVPFKIGLKHFHYVSFLFITVSVSVLVLFFTLGFQKKLKLLRKAPFKQILSSLLAGLLNPFLYYLMLFKAYSVLPAQIAQALNYTWPIMLVVLSVPFLGQKLNKKSVVTLFVGFIGVYFIASQGNLWPMQPAHPQGVLLALGSSLVWALYWIINTKSKLDALVSLFYNFISGWIFVFIVLLLHPLDFNVPNIAWFTVLYAGFFEMGITFIIWLTALRLTQRTDQISNFVYLSPFLSLFFINLFLHESIYYTTLIGLLLIIFSVLFQQKQSKIN